MTQQTILITGATTGIGKHAALALARQGYKVIATGRKREALQQVRQASGNTVEILELDVTSSQSIRAAEQEVLRMTENRGLDVLINNAGYGMAAPLIETTEGDLRDQFETNVFGLMAVTRAFVGPMLRRGSGRLINVSSVGGRVTFPFFGAYNATKYAVESLSDALRRELGPFGIQVTLVEPGPIRSEFAQKSMDYVAKYRNANSPYATVYENAERVRAATDAQAAGPEVVTRAIEHAIRARRARPRYVVPFSSRLMLMLFGILPTRWVDRLMQRFMRIVPGPARAAELVSKPEQGDVLVRAGTRPN
jgi:short-subunit dehydrogenase